MSTVIPNTAPAELLASVRGRVTDAWVTPSGRIRLLFTDPGGGKWGLKSWEADYWSSVDGDPGGKAITAAELDEVSGVLTVTFSDGTYLALTPSQEVDEGSIEDWELFIPGGLVLTYGPRGRWRLGSAARS